MKLFTRIRLALNIINGSKFNLVDGLVLFDALKKDQPGLFSQYDATTAFLDTLNKKLDRSLSSPPAVFVSGSSHPTPRMTSMVSNLEPQKETAPKPTRKIPSTLLEKVKQALHPHQLRALNGCIITNDNEKWLTLRVNDSTVVTKKDTLCMLSALRREFERLGYTGTVQAIYPQSKGELPKAVAIAVDSLKDQFTVDEVAKLMPDLGIITTRATIVVTVNHYCADKGYRRVHNGVYSKT